MFSKRIWLIGLLALIHAPLFFVSNFRYSDIVIHHTASSQGDFNTVNRGHLRKYGGMAYHLLLSNGTGEAPLGHLQSGWRYRSMIFSLATRNKSCNLRAIHLVVVGNYEDEALPVNMKVALTSAIRAIQVRYRIPEDRIRLHRECSATVCPGKYITVEKVMNWLGSVAGDSDLAFQHQSHLDKAFLGPVPIGPLLVTLPFSGLVCLITFFRAKRASRLAVS